MRTPVTVLLTLVVAFMVALAFIAADNLAGRTVIEREREHRRERELFADNADTITSRVCAVRAADGARFEFSDPDMPAVRSVPGGSAGRCYFLRSPEDAKDPDCTRPGRWGVGGQGGKKGLVGLKKGFVNGADRCLFDVAPDLPRETYAALQSEMRDEYVALDGAPAAGLLAAEQAEGRRLQGFLSGTADYGRQRNAKLCHTAATVAPGRWTAADTSAAASLVEQAANGGAPLPRSLTADASFLRDAADRICRGERDRCHILRPSFDADAPVSSDEARRDARWLAAVIAGAYPAATATDAELGRIARSVCADAGAGAGGPGTKRCEVLRSDWPAVSARHWSRWGASEREAAADLVRSLAGVETSHLSDAELSSLSKRVCALEAATVGIEGVPPGDTAPPCAVLSRVLGGSRKQAWDVQALKTTPVLRWTPEDRALATETVRIVGGRQFGAVDDRSQIADALRKSC